jgi:4-diphosphocytidyl-2-C-methyl-D-erythritol kinase
MPSSMPFAIRPQDGTLQIGAPAKLNLRLRIIARRPDGYHELSSVMVPVGLFDRLRVKRIPDGPLRLECRGLPLPEGGKNIVWRAAEAFFAATRATGAAVIRLFKKIPVAAGLGGGSSDAAATLVALNRLWDDPLPVRALKDLAVGLGADVPFFLEGRPCIARGIGEILEPIRNWPVMWYVLIMPPIAVSTSWAYGNLKLQLTRSEDNGIFEMLGVGSFRISDILENDLETVTAARFPIINSLKESLKKAGAIGSLMTGSGPSVFGIFESRNHALRAKKMLIPQNLGDIFAVKGIG